MANDVKTYQYHSARSAGEPRSAEVPVNDSFSMVSTSAEVPVNNEERRPPVVNKAGMGRILLGMSLDHAHKQGTQGFDQLEGNRAPLQERTLQHDDLNQAEEKPEKAEEAHSWMPAGVGAVALMLAPLLIL